MITREEVDLILSTTPTTSDEAIDLLQKIEDAYGSIDGETRKLVKPYYDSIKQIHEKASSVSNGLWEKRTEVRSHLVMLIEKEKIKSGTHSR